MPMRTTPEAAPERRIEAEQTVTWTSQAGSYVKSKTGVVLAFVPAWANSRAFAPQAFQEGRRAQRQFDSVSSSVDRYIVEVRRTGAKGKALPPYYYAPVASVVEKQNPDVRYEGDPLSASLPEQVRGWKRAEAAGFGTPHRETLRLTEPWDGFEAGTVFTDAKEIPEEGAPHREVPVRFFMVAQTTKQPVYDNQGLLVQPGEAMMTMVSTRSTFEVVE